jgi:hypothetical protein
MCFHKITIAAVYCLPRHNIKEEHYAAFFQTLGPRFLAGEDFNSKHTLWGSRLITTKGRKLAKTIQNNTYSYLSTGLSTYWPTDTNKTLDLLDFFITNRISTDHADVEASYDLTYDHSPIIATISTTVMIQQPPSRLHTSHTHWKTYKTINCDNVDLTPKLKTSDNIEIASDNFISTLQQAAHLATPIRTPLCTSTTLPVDIKRMVYLSSVEPEQ